MSTFSPLLWCVLFGWSVAQGQTLPHASRTAFKCVQNGRVVYSDTPCPGAERIDVQPTRGLNRSTGRELMGSDVRRELHREQFAAALRPITGMSASQFNTAGRRQQLSASAQKACRELDAQVPALERAEQSSAGAERTAVQDRLFKARGAYRGLGC